MLNEGTRRSSERMEGQIVTTYHDGSDLRVRLEKRLLKHLQSRI